MHFGLKRDNVTGHIVQGKESSLKIITTFYILDYEHQVWFTKSMHSLSV